MKERFYSFNNYLKGVFGQRVHRLSLDAGFSCPNLDGTLGSSGCIYCNNRGFSRYAYTDTALESQIEESIKFYNKRYGVKKFIAYFQAFTNTYASMENLSQAYEVIRRYPQIVGLTISTRPDCVNEEKIKNIAKFFDLISKFSHIAKIDHVPQFIEQLDLLMEAGDDPSQDEYESLDNACQVLTFHKAKGLEFPVVFMVGLVSDRFPTRHKREAIPLPDELVKDILPTGDFHIQEERRLFYVGMTRSKRELYFTSAESYGGVRAKKVSQFVLEALDQPRADIEVFKSTALESIQRHAAQKKTRIGRQSARKGIINLSYYQIDDYLTCPLKYKYIHVLRVPILQHHTVVYGKALHDAINQYHLMRMKGERVTLEQLFSIFENLWRSEGFLTRDHEERRFQSGREALAKFYNSEEKSPYLPVFVEEKFSFIRGENRIVGRWDRIDIRDDNVYVIDYKSSDVKKQKDADKRTKDSLQLAIYTLACRERFPNKNIICQLHFLESGLIGETIYKESKLSKTEAKIEEAARGIRTFNYKATPGYISCRYCAYNQICKKGTDLFLD